MQCCCDIYNNDSFSSFLSFLKEREKKKYSATYVYNHRVPGRVKEVASSSQQQPSVHHLVRAIAVDVLLLLLLFRARTGKGHLIGERQQKKREKKNAHLPASLGRLLCIIYRGKYAHCPAGHSRVDE